MIHMHDSLFPQQSLGHIYAFSWCLLLLCLHFYVDDDEICRCQKPSETADLADPRIRDEQFLTLIYVENDK